jgi:hypothetical protein
LGRMRAAWVREALVGLLILLGIYMLATGLSH